MNQLERLIRSLSRLPGVGRKSAARIAHYLLKADSAFVTRLAEEIGTLKERIHPCPVCGNFTEDELCSVCSDPRRDGTQICVVEEPQDVATIESTGEYNGLFHVLGGAINPMNGVGPSDLSIDKLVKRASEGTVKEIIIATNPTVEGDTTALYLQNILKERPIEVSRLASGLPVGGDLEYADKLTLARSFRGRTKL
ncbi:recombination mediator RecR [Sediminispirochaeta smaragdinae]|jgi:recombination protein RecR|uniref:Recombination protein RecR n=1 Tax=Sediminispirochaeta smaragdinae (strain DSM 11293 / JCM 15392 / SEBR 4228) TaxID=573413 RepID=E1R8A2_SEDSS|nr:recombination mediator RecR [Sediminispirochaeta smaragdinae]ADK79246.1 recombination protein RecR [Sediminispirochaeta smaragdinae DSM 11293]